MLTHPFFFDPPDLAARASLKLPNCATLPCFARKTRTKNRKIVLAAPVCPRCHVCHRRMVPSQVDRVETSALHKFVGEGSATPRFVTDATNPAKGASPPIKATFRPWGNPRSGLRQFPTRLCHASASHTRETRAGPSPSKSSCCTSDSASIHVHHARIARGAGEADALHFASFCAVWIGKGSVSRSHRPQPKVPLLAVMQVAPSDYCPMQIDPAGAVTPESAFDSTSSVNRSVPHVGGCAKQC